jgi:hypothetical protein
VLPVLEEEYDVGRWFNKALTDSDKKNLIQKCWAPPVNFQFQKCTEGPCAGRCFQAQWLIRWKFLRYSKILNSAFCLPCFISGLNEFKRSRFLPCP